ncbi:hypothetical protein PQX77_011616 [Marasmius sp. AFHP31]|nr:hypothetical protein PQX77_011616 [Marasmius sp. AFHP31]
MQLPSLFTPFVVIAAATSAVMGESHTVQLINKCGRGTPKLVQAGRILSSGGTFKAGGPLNAIAYLHTGECGLNGENCTLVEMTLKNPTSDQPGSGSSADISLIPPYKFNVPVSFHFTNGCSNGVICPNANCPGAFHRPDDNQLVTICQANDAGLVITFCP